MGLTAKEEVRQFLLKKYYLKYLEEFKNYSREEILDHRKEKFLNIGKT